MTESNNAMGRYYDTSHKPINFHVGDWVMLKTDNIRTTNTCKKLTEKYIGPFQIAKKNTDQTYQLDLNDLVGRIHNIFHVEKLEKSKTPQQGQQHYGREWFADDDESLKYLIDVIDSRLTNNIIQYRVIWSDRSSEWINSIEFDDDNNEINTFHNTNPEKPAPSHRILNRDSRMRKPPTRYNN